MAHGEGYLYRYLTFIPKEYATEDITTKDYQKAINKLYKKVEKKVEKKKEINRDLSFINKDIVSFTLAKKNIKKKGKKCLKK